VEILNLLLTSGIFEEEIVLQRNEFLKVQNTIDNNIYFVKNGSLKVSVFNDKQEQIIRFGYQGDLISAIDSFITEKPSEFAIQAIKKTIVLAAKKKKFTEFIYSSPETVQLYIQTMEGLILQQIEREKDLLLDSPKDRFERVFQRNPKIFQLIPDKHIANYLRMSPETLSRLKKS
jgi:CRP-like cAMP-binding protein